MYRDVAAPAARRAAVPANAVVRQCHGCRRPAGPAHRYCVRCGSPLARRTPVPTLRRTITALYAEVCGLIAFGVGALVRNTAAALTIAYGGLTLLPQLVKALPAPLYHAVVAWVPGGPVVGFPKRPPGAVGAVLADWLDRARRERGLVYTRFISVLPSSSDDDGMTGHVPAGYLRRRPAAFGLRAQIGCPRAPRHYERDKPEAGHSQRAQEHHRHDGGDVADQPSVQGRIHPCEQC